MTELARPLFVVGLSMTSTQAVDFFFSFEEEIKIIGRKIVAPISDGNPHLNQSKVALPVDSFDSNLRFTSY